MWKFLYLSIICSGWTIKVAVFVLENNDDNNNSQIFKGLKH